MKFKQGLFACALAALSVNAFANGDTNKSERTVTDVVVVDSAIDTVNMDARRFHWKDAEYFVSPVIGIYDAAPAVVISGSATDHDVDNAGSTKTELGGLIGLLFDGQYRIVSSEYWRAGFQTGIVYHSRAETEFDWDSDDCSSAICSASIKVSSVHIPVLFTVSRYSTHGKYILSGKIGPEVVMEMYDADDIPGYDINTDSQNNINLVFGIDGRYRLNHKHFDQNMLLVGFNFSVNNALDRLFENGFNSSSGNGDVGGAPSVELYAGISF